VRFRLKNGLAVGYRTSGAGRVLVLLHPVGTRAEFWDGMSACLEKEYRLLAIDLRGYGESDTPSERFTLDELADDVIELLRAQEIRDSVIVGCSMGGMVAQGMALRAPDLFSGLVLTGTIHTQTPERRHIPLQRANESLAGMPPTAGATLQRWFPAEFLAADGPVVQRVRRWLMELDPVVFSWSWEAIAGLNYGDRLREIAIPALLLRGTEDAAGRAMPEMAKLIPRGHFLEIPNGGHMVPMEQPEVVAAALREFIHAEIER
jgi:pimeloyl-ACP methyl ester carboxylesterase